ncbi:MULTISPECIES: hypothetical protein [unclassified Corallococcus]|uniref:hypothetical protein n=1 Tax=unclassified Corallococcus TaxID=2685029 RepID=UPI001A8BFE7B|nr:MULTISPECIES: hypothetical protein [unclassified Corallococcus]MBN9685006.1 hypothetical protein [Corallococcus sp. NCSPR001]WAS83534.1 hypothetical protein O0N60_29990 [Corallococcus sp. NCRR]
MAWTFKYIEKNDARVVITSMATEISQLTENEAATAKAAHTDARHRDSRGAVLYNKDAGTPPPYNLEGTWTERLWTFDPASDYTTNLLELCKFLNDVLTPTEAAYAKFSMSDYYNGTCYMLLVYQRAS